MLTLLIAAAVLAACTGLRRFLNREGRKSRTFWGGRIRLTALWNDGAAFSLPLKRTLVSALSILILPLVWVFRRRSPIGAGLALGGGVSNLWERLKNRRVYDYVQFPKLPKLGRYVWNLADFAILLGGVLLVSHAPNVSLSGLAFSIDLVIPFLNMTKQFTGNVNQVSQQINSVVMAGAGAGRIFSLMDEAPEPDEGYVTLVNARMAADGTVTEQTERTGQWAWKHPHKDGGVTYTPLRGDVRLTDVDFAYESGKPVLHGVSVFAEPGQKVAFVGATGAGKTTITNLINRFYDIADGKVRYDGINIRKIKKADLRRSLGIVLQDTNLFTGTVMENIRYGNLDADDEA